MMQRLAARSKISGLLLGALIFTGAILTLSQNASATKIQRVVSPGGIEAWLVEQHSVPMIAVRVGFKGGTANDPAGKSGLANLLSGTMDEGAGELDSARFQRRLEELTMSLSFSAGRDEYYAKMKTLTKNRDEAFYLLQLALTKPRFDAEAVERIRRQVITGLKSDERDPDTLAYKAWFKQAFGEHPYGRNKKGTIESVKAITPDDLKVFARKLTTRDVMRITVVGDIDAKTLGALLDKTFLELPAKSGLGKITDTGMAQEGSLQITRMDIPQSVIVFGMRGLKRHDPDFIPAYILNYILGGGGFSSRLTEEVREKRGLTYSIYTFLLPLRHAGVFMGSASTKNSSVAETIDIVKKEIERMAQDGVSEEELNSAKTYLTGSFPLRFDSSTKIARQLISIQMEEMGIDYIKKRNSLIEAVTLEDMKRVAKRILKPGNLQITVIGSPDGLKASGQQ